MTTTKHKCSANLEALPARNGRWGQAVTKIVRDEEGTWWADNEEYSTTIRFCPFCGVDLHSIPGHS